MKSVPDESGVAQQAAEIGNASVGAHFSFRDPADDVPDQRILPRNDANLTAWRNVGAVS